MDTATATQANRDLWATATQANRELSGMGSQEFPEESRGTQDYRVDVGMGCQGYPAGLATANPQCPEVWATETKAYPAQLATANPQCPEQTRESREYPEPHTENQQNQAAHKGRPQSREVQK